MEQKEIARRNIAIAAYMGIKKRRGKKNQVPYHEDWSLIMPVVEKIIPLNLEGLRLAIFPIRNDSPVMFPYRLNEALFPNDGSDKPLIERVWFAVSEYVLALK